MRYETKTNFAKRAGISRQAVYKLLNEGKLTVGSTGKLDVMNKTNLEYLSSKKGGLIPNSKKPKKQAIKEGKADRKTTNQPTKDNNDGIVELQGDLNTISHASANKLKTIESIRKIQIANDAARLELVSRESVKKVFSKLYQIDINQLRTLGPNLSPDIAALIGTDDNEIMLKISDLVDKEVFVILKQIKRLLNDFLKDIKSEGIK